MIRGLPTTILCACLAGAVGVGLFFIKHEVKEQEARLAELNDEIQTNQEAMHVLKAEWSYLNDPTRLRALSEKHLSMKVMGPSQIASLDTLPVASTTFAAARTVTPAPAVARAEVAAPVTHVAAPAAITRAAAPVAVAKVTAKPAAPVVAAVKPTVAKPAVAVAAAKPAPVVLVPGADTTPRLAAAPAPMQTPTPAPAQRTPAAPSRSLVIQSPALASTPALPGEIR